MSKEMNLIDLQSIGYLILLMDSIGWKVDAGKVSRFWTESLKQKELSAEFIQFLIFFWEQARKQMTDNPLPAGASFPGPDEEPAAPSPETAGDHGMANRILPVADPVPEAKKDFKEPATLDLNPASPLPETEQDWAELDAGDLNPPISPGDTQLSGRYIYGIVLGAKDFHTTGIEGNPVFTVSYGDITALVHSCDLKAYESDDREQVEKWLRQHQNVMDEALEYTNSLIPMSFDIIIDGSSAPNPDDVLKQWLKERYDRLKDLLEQFSGRAEYGIKIFCPNESLTEKVAKEDPEIVELSNRLATMSKGTAFLFRSELSQKIRNAVARECKVLANEIIAKIRPMVIDIKESAPDKEISNNQRSILHLAVLINPDKVELIGDFLENLQASGQYAVVFTGPWPAYSFVKDIA
jgi:hypothetical protein